MDSKLQPDHLAGTVLRNSATGKSYKVVELLYEGSQAYIYIAFDQQVETKVIVKALKYDTTPEEGETLEDMIHRRREGAEWEYKMLVAIHDELSSAVPQVIDFIHTDSYNPWVLSLDDSQLHHHEPYLILEKISGKNLRQLELPMALEIALLVGLSLALFLDLIHRKGFIYQSLTPENIILGEDGLNISIIDFDSICKIGEESNLPSDLPPEKQGFLPPEVNKDIRCDIYSLGAVLYYLLTGVHPGLDGLDFTHTDFIQLPPTVQELIHKCMAPLSSRFSTAMEVASRIEDILDLRKLPRYDVVESPKRFPIRPGTLLKNGTYRVIGGLSSGGQGRVYIAENTHLGTKVLIKTPYYSSSFLGEISPEERLEVAREVHSILEFEKDMLSKFHMISAMVPQPMDFFYDKGYEMAVDVYLEPLKDEIPYLVLEYLQGHTLMEVGRLRGKEALLIGDRLCHIINCFHRENYIYQDLKLANIIIDERGQNIYLIDLGSLCAIDSSTGFPQEEMATYGTYTPGYRAPEWIEGPQACDYRSDIYTIGATLWALMTGESPTSYFHDWEEILSSRRKQGMIGELTFEECLYEVESPQLPLEDLKLLPEEQELGIGEIIKRALARNPEHRFEHVRQMRVEIQRVLMKIKEGLF